MKIIDVHRSIIAPSKIGKTKISPFILCVLYLVVHLGTWSIWSTLLNIQMTVARFIPIITLKHIMLYNLQYLFPVTYSATYGSHVLLVYLIWSKRSFLNYIIVIELISSRWLGSFLCLWYNELRQEYFNGVVSECKICISNRNRILSRSSGHSNPIIGCHSAGARSTLYNQNAVMTYKHGTGATTKKKKKKKKWHGSLTPHMETI